MSKPIRILHVLNGLGTGGAEAMIMNWYRYINREKVQFDFLVRSNQDFYTKEIEEYGGRIFVMPPYPKCYFANKKETTRFFREHGREYAGIHVHGNALLYVNVFQIARKSGIDLRIYHSHSTFTSSVYRPVHMLNRLRIKKLATDFFACSQAAGVWAFQSSPCKVINNGIVTERFSYSEESRKRIREQLGLTDETVYGHAGRFEPVKNHIFLLDIFGKILEKDENSVLLLLGEGSLANQIKEAAQEKGIARKVRFLGRQENVGEYLSAMDVFLLPSLHEGMPVVAVEAQASGLPCLLSDTIPMEVALTELVQYLPLGDGNVWADRALKASSRPRQDTREAIERAGYDINHSTQFLEQFYLKTQRS